MLKFLRNSLFVVMVFCVGVKFARPEYQANLDFKTKLIEADLKSWEAAKKITKAEFEQTNAMLETLRKPGTGTSWVLKQINPIFFCALGLNFLLSLFQGFQARSKKATVVMNLE